MNNMDRTRKLNNAMKELFTFHNFIFKIKVFCIKTLSTAVNRRIISRNALQVTFVPNFIMQEINPVITEKSIYITFIVKVLQNFLIIFKWERWKTFVLYKTWIGSFVNVYLNFIFVFLYSCFLWGELNWYLSYNNNTQHYFEYEVWWIPRKISTVNTVVRW